MNTVERVARAIEATPGVFWRKNKMNDASSLYEVCINYDPVHVDPKVICAFATEADAEHFVSDFIRKAKARAAIEELREPSEAMRRAGETCATEYTTWQAMIDAALAEGSGE